MGHQCLKTALLPLRDSSREAIADGLRKPLGDVKLYLHVERDIDTELEDIVTKARVHPAKQLVLICGNVGDGKSHILSFLRQMNESLLDEFHVHNDATESFRPNRTSLDELSHLLAPFSDEHLTSGNEKVVLAINLGTLSNFLAADTESSFCALREYVSSARILDTGVSQSKGFDAASHFQHVTFCDHPLFHLERRQTVSDLIVGAIGAVVSPNADNPFHAGYLAHIENHPDRCPMRANYEFLRNPDYQRALAALLSRGIVQSHCILSVRALYSLIYDLIVPPELATCDCVSGRRWTEQQPAESLLRVLLPNSVFEHGDLSDLFRELKPLDPANSRDESTDSAALKLGTGWSVKRAAAEMFPETEIPSLHADLLDCIGPAGEQTRLATLLRLVHASGGKFAEDSEQFYADYLELLYLYYSGLGSTRDMKPVYELVRGALSSWWGKAPKGLMGTQIGRLQLDYRLSQELELTPAPPELTKVRRSEEDSERVRHFDTRILLGFKLGDQAIHLDVDFRLYCLLRGISDGYQPTAADHADFAVFHRFAGDVARMGETDTVYITESANGQHYSLVRDAFGDYCFGEVS
jgi:DNA phosphorothioation-dependent restriction protein DptF